MQRRGRYFSSGIFSSVHHHHIASAIDYFHTEMEETTSAQTYVELILPSHLLQPSFLLGRFSTLKIEVMLSSETSIHMQTALRYIPEYGTFLFRPDPKEKQVTCDYWEHI
jgi:hypothetical protein